MTPLKKPAMRYHGAKFRLAPWVISHFPAHRCYVECFGGAAGVLLRKEPSYSEVYNDLDSEIVNFFQVLRDPVANQQLERACRLTPYSREEFVLACQAYEGDCPVERARRVVVRATMGFGVAAGTAGNTGFRTDTKRKYGNAMHLWAEYPDHMAELGKRFTGVLIENRDALQVMQAHDTPDTLHYVDPPYLPETRCSRNRYYRHEMTVADHEVLLSGLKQLEGMIIISGYESDLYNDLLPGWQLSKTTARMSAGRGTGLRTECLWINPAAVAAKEKEAEQCAA
jgi:DNA adenine methylase